MPSTSTVRAIIASHSIKKLPPDEKETAWYVWDRVDAFHYENIGTYWVGIVTFLFSQVLSGLMFGEVTERAIELPFWGLCIGLAATIAIVLIRRIWYVDPRTIRRLADLRSELYASPEKQNAFRFLCRSRARDLMPERVLAACE